MLAARCRTPLCPAGHLPLKGGDSQFRLRGLSFEGRGCRKLLRRLISPLEGEMPGRAEGGTAKRHHHMECPE